MKTTLLILSLFLLPAFIVAQVEQENYNPPEASLALNTPQEQMRQPEKFSKVVEYIEKALQAGSADALSKNFSKKVSLNLLGEGSGIYSLNQAYYIIRTFFENHKLLGVELSQQGDEANDYFASGSGTTMNRGKHETIKIFVGFVRTNKGFQISQLTIF